MRIFNVLEEKEVLNHLADTREENNVTFLLHKSKEENCLIFSYTGLFALINKEIVLTEEGFTLKQDAPKDKWLPLELSNIIKYENSLHTLIQNQLRLSKEKEDILKGSRYSCRVPRSNIALFQSGATLTAAPTESLRTAIPPVSDSKEVKSEVIFPHPEVEEKFRELINRSTKEEEDKFIVHIRSNIDPKNADAFLHYVRTSQYHRLKELKNTENVTLFLLGANFISRDEAYNLLHLLQLFATYGAENVQVRPFYPFLYLGGRKELTCAAGEYLATVFDNFNGYKGKDERYKYGSHTFWSHEVNLKEQIKTAPSSANLFYQITVIEEKVAPWLGKFKKLQEVDQHQRLIAPFDSTDSIYHSFFTPSITARNVLGKICYGDHWTPQEYLLGEFGPEKLAKALLERNIRLGSLFIPGIPSPKKVHGHTVTPDGCFRHDQYHEFAFNALGPLPSAGLNRMVSVLIKPFQEIPLWIKDEKKGDFLKSKKGSSGSMTSKETWELIDRNTSTQPWKAATNEANLSNILETIGKRVDTLYPWCNLFLMSYPFDGVCKISNQINLYLYRTHSHLKKEIFYYTEEEKDRIVIEGLSCLEDAEFNSHAGNLIPCKNKKITEAVLNITSVRKHTSPPATVKSSSVALWLIVMDMVDEGRLIWKDVLKIDIEGENRKNLFFYAMIDFYVSHKNTVGFPQLTLEQKIFVLMREYNRYLNRFQPDSKSESASESKTPVSEFKFVIDCPKSSQIRFFKNSKKASTQEELRKTNCIYLCETPAETKSEFKTPIAATPVVESTLTNTFVSSRP